MSGCSDETTALAAVVERRLTLSAEPELAAHASAAIARHSRRGWRLDKAARADNIDAAIALCMAVERAEHQSEPTQVVAWL